MVLGFRGRGGRRKRQREGGKGWDVCGWRGGRRVCVCVKAQAQSGAHLFLLLHQGKALTEPPACVQGADSDFYLSIYLSIYMYAHMHTHTHTHTHTSCVQGGDGADSSDENHDMMIAALVEGVGAPGARVCRVHGVRGVRACVPGGW